MNQNDVGPKLPVGVELIRDPSNDTIRVVKGTGLTPILMKDKDYSTAVANEEPGAISIAFINAYRRLFKLHDPMHELNVSKIQTDQLGMTHVRLKQQYEGIEVWPADINVHLNKTGDVYLVQGRYAKTPSHVEKHPRLAELDALHVVAKDVGIATDKLRKYRRTALIFYCGLVGASRLAYRIYAEIRVDNAWNYIVDAQTGSILEKASAIQNEGGARQSSTGKIILK